MIHEKSCSEGFGSGQPNDVQPEFLDVVPSRREAISFAASIFKGVDASTIDVMKMAEAIYQFLVGKLRVDLTDDYGKSLFPVNNLADSGEKLKNVIAVGYGEACEVSSAVVEDVEVALVFARGDTCRNFPDQSFSGSGGVGAHKESSFLGCGKHKVDGADSSGNAAARSADASKTA